MGLCSSEVEDDLHRLRSDICSVLHQIDEVVAQAIQVNKRKSISKYTQSQIHSFSRLLSDILSSLKPWIPKFENGIEPEGTSLVSPSPLVSWRGNCTIERGREMFMLTPLPSSSSIHTVTRVQPFKPHNPDLMMTPCPKMSPPKSCLLLEPISHLGLRKPTPYPVGIHCTPSHSQSSRDLSRMYPELLGIHHVPIGNKTLQPSPDWFTSPPKTCVLLEPPDENILNKQLTNFQDDVSKHHNQLKISCNQDHFVGNLSHIESTSMPESSFKTGKRPGENTLKKELWTKFEAASTWGCQPKLPTVQQSAHKGFLDLLEEASCDE